MLTLMVPASAEPRASCNMLATVIDVVMVTEPGSCRSWNG